MDMDLVYTEHGYAILIMNKRVANSTCTTGNINCCPTVLDPVYKTSILSCEKIKCV